MAITIHCDCGAKLQVKDEYAGQEGRCPKCGQTLMIPHPDAPLDVLDEVEPATPTYQVREEEDDREPERERERSRRSARQEEPPDDEDPVQLTDHGGEELPSWMDFFADPPKKIGTVISACSTLRKGVKPWSPGARAGVVLFVAALGLVIGLMISSGFHIREPFWAGFWPILLTSLLALIAFLSTGFSHTVTYIGRLGLARYTCSGNRDNVSTKEVFLFADAEDLRTKTVLHYTNGAYQHTNYTYTWNDRHGGPCFIITGQHNSEAGNPPTTHAFQFARAGEIAWTLFLLAQMREEDERKLSVQFHLTGDDWIKLSKDGIRFKVGGMKEDWTVREIGSVSVNAGTVVIRHRDAQEGWFSSSGIVKFQYDQLANAQLFFHVMEKLVGVQVNG